MRERGRPFSVSSSRLRGPPTKERRQLPSDFIQRAISATPEEQSPAVIADSNAMWSLFGQAPGTHLESTSKSALWASTPLAELHDFISHFSDPSHPLLPLDTPTLPMYISTHLLGPLLAHSTLVATSLVSLFLDDLRFLDHLDVLRAFWLGGDIGFSQKVNGALFGKDGAGAGEALGLGRRARTRVRLGLGGTDAGVGDEDWGIGLGLGLSERQRWPAGGAELAYALRTTLMDEESSVDTGKGPVWEGIEDRVSFAVRALPEGKADGRRASWMDPQGELGLSMRYVG